MSIRRTGWFYLALIMAFMAILFRTFWLSMGDNANLSQKVISNRKSTIILYRTKGLIYDKNLQPIAGNQKCYYMVVDPRNFSRESLNDLEKICHEEREELLQKLGKETPFVVKCMNKPPQMEGATIYEGEERYSGIASHLLGYLDGDGQLGLSGIEKEFSDYLGLFSAEVGIQYSADALGGIIPQNGLEEQKENPSKNGLILTLDKEWCIALEEAMKQHIEKGAAVILDCKSGEIKSICSRPDYEEEKITDYLESTEGELVNRALSSQAVGSVFKIILAACALERGLEDFTYSCSGGIVISDQTIACHNHSGHGELGLADAFANSCNSYFIALGQMLGYPCIKEMAERFGFGEQIEIIGSIKSSAGIFPEEGGGLALANLSIGQGKLMASPLQIARMTATVANGGILPDITVYKGLYLSGKIKKSEEGQQGARILSEEVARKLQSFCIQTVEKGTGTDAKPEKGNAGGKTSSAQTGIFKNDAEQLNVYFTGFYPAEEPRYVVTVFAEDGISGGKTCGPVFREICDFISENCLTE